MATSFLGDLKASAKQRAVKSIANNMFGSGVLGKSLGKTFAEKFGEKEQSTSDDPRVVQALDEQQQVHKENNSILVRMERIVMNISDNVYNIAGVLNDQVVSMREARRLRDEQHSRDMAAQEEAAAETQKQLNPTASATTPPSKEGGEKKNMLASILGDVGSTKKMLGKFLKKFAVFAVGLTAVLGVGGLATSALAKTIDEKEETATGQTSAAPTDTSLDLNDIVPASPTPVTKEADTPASFMTKAATRFGGEQGAKNAPAISAMLSAGASGDMGGFISAAKDHAAANPPPAPTPIAPPPSPAATNIPPAAVPPATPQSSDDTIKMLETNIQSNNKRLADREARSKMRTDDWKKRYADDPTKLNELLEKDKIAMDDYRGMVQGANKEAQQQIDTLKKQPAAASSSASSQPPTPSSSSSGATPVLSAPSTGKDIATQSTEVAAAASAPPPSQNQVIDTTQGQAPPPLTPGGVEMPSPIANRGSLDKDTTFEASR